MNLNPLGDCGFSKLGSKEIKIDDLLTIKLFHHPYVFQKKDEMYFNIHRFKYLNLYYFL